VTPLALPLTLAKIFHHTGISVPDVEVAGRFYSQLFGGQNVNGEREPFVRYFIKLNPGEVAIGKLGTLGSTGRTVPLIDHICVDAVPFDDAAWRARLAVERRQYIAQGVFLGLDNIPVQVAGGEGGESLAAGEVTQMPSLYDGPALVAPHGFDHVVMAVSNVADASIFWQRMFGLSELGLDAGVLWLGNGGTSRLGLRLARDGEDFGAVYQAVRGIYEPESTRSALQGLGAQLLPALAYDAPASVRFIGPDGIETLLVPAA
jgi:catechol 2,3-dioxygenase-like lactoylglutathione lyase family enzyme